MVYSWAAPEEILIQMDNHLHYNILQIDSRNISDWLVCEKGRKMTKEVQVILRLRQMLFSLTPKS